MSESYFEIKGRIVGTSNLEQRKQGGEIVGVDIEPTEVRQYLTVIAQNNPRQTFVVDVTGMPPQVHASDEEIAEDTRLGRGQSLGTISSRFPAQSEVTIRITKEN